MSRPKGYAEWAPTAETFALVAQVRDVLREYADHLPLTVRQIFYRLVGQYDYDKTERAYKRLANNLVRARRARLIPFDAIRDDGTVAQGGGGYRDAAAFWRAVKASAEWYERDRQQGQPHRVELWCEAAGMVPQLVRAVEDFSIPVYSTGGFSSVTVTNEIAERALRRDAPTLFMHVGDYDPSGESIFTAMAQDAGAFVVGSVGGKWNRATGETIELRDGSTRLFKPIRVALTEEQVVEHDLPTAPPKTTDSRSGGWVETCQAEAMPPDLLAATVRAAVEEHLDRDAYDEQLDLEAEERESIAKVLEGLDR